MASFITTAAQFVTFSDDVANKYSGAGGAGDDAFEYRRGSGASAISFVLALNAAYNENRPLSRPAIENAQMNMLEAKLWPGKTRGGASPALASMFGRGFLAHAGGAYALSQRGLTCARVMFADMGIAWPTADELAPAPIAPVVAEEIAQNAPESTNASAEGQTAGEGAEVAPATPETPKKRKGSAGRKRAAKGQI